MLRLLSFLLCSIVLYFYIYSPVLHSFPILIHAIITLVAVAYIVFIRHIGKYFGLFKKELVLLFYIFVFSAVVSVIHNGLKFDIIVLYDFFLFLQSFLVPYVIILLFDGSLKIKVNQIVIFNGIIAGCIAVALLMNPSWADVMKTQILIIPDKLIRFASYRCFGFSDGLTYAFPIVQGFCAGFIICGMIKSNVIYSLGLIPILISILVNARTGIIPILIALVLVMVYSSPRKVAKIIMIFFCVLLLVMLFYNPKSDNQLIQSVEWGISFFHVMGAFFSGEDTETMDALAGTMVIFPHSLFAWLLGEGESIFLTTFKDYGHSDIGYCIRIVYGGIFYMLLWVSLCILMFKRLFKINKEMALLLFVSLLYLNWKGDFFSLNPGSRFFFFVYAYCIMDNNVFRKKNLKYSHQGY